MSSVADLFPRTPVLRWAVTLLGELDTLRLARRLHGDLSSRNVLRTPADDVELVDR